MISEKLQKALRDHELQARLVGAWQKEDPTRQRGEKALARYRAALIEAIEAEIVAADEAGYRRRVTEERAGARS